MDLQQQFLKEDFQKNLNKKQASDFLKIKSPEALKSFINANKALFSSMESSLNEEELSNQFFDILKDAQKIAYFKVFKNDLISSKVDGKFIKGKVISENDTSFTINHLSKGEIQVPKESSIKMFPGQKFDIRELDGIITKNYSENLKINNLAKSDRIKLLKGDETGVLNVTLKINDDVIKQDKIRIKISKTDNKLYLNAIQAFDKKIYNKTLPYEIIKELKQGKEIPMEFQTKKGKSFTATVYWDKDMNGLRTKTSKDKTQNKEKTKDIKLENKQEKKKSKKIKL